MTHLMRLGVAACLAMGAATMNWLWLTAEKKPPMFVAVKSEVDAGTEFSSDNLVAIPIPGEAGVLKKSFIPFANRAVLFGLAATREYRPGDVIFQRDIKPPKESTSWEVIGPFRLISVGERFRNPGSESADENYRQGGNNVTIAVPRNFDAATQRLLEVINPKRAEKDDPNQVRIVAVQVVPADAVEPISEQSSADIVYQTISLDGIENVPRVLLEGDRIRFVLPGDHPF